VVANLFGLQYSSHSYWTFVWKEAAECSSYGVNLWGVRDRLKTWLKNLSLENLPVSTVRQLRKTVRDTIADLSAKRTNGIPARRIGGSLGRISPVYTQSPAEFPAAVGTSLKSSAKNWL